MKISFKNISAVFFVTASLLLTAQTAQDNQKERMVTPSKDKTTTNIFLAGDSTLTDYSLESNYQEKRYPQQGWGGVFQEFFVADSLKTLKSPALAKNVLVVDKAKGGRSTRTFFQEGRWRYIFENLKQKDWVLIQFGHNDESVKKVDRYVDVPGYKEYLRLFISQVREKGATPVLVTSVSRNSPWKDGVLGDSHPEYAPAMIEVAQELKVDLIDLNKLSREMLTKKGKDYVTTAYFMNLPEGKYPAYPNGQKDDTHFQPEGAKAMAQIVYDEFKKIVSKK
ncbi:rhamnogalacturonan acetylesterase [Chryseobacterium sp. FH1]|uniref:rhamnogalacturonan acetylesterase n=1 Tax=Chryseobacterium sp. FH1 TaxID=1233951 RepID=UPI0004E3726B|nr:rhamnogalacturonan acetylesterase [Chryseobacterium sp. FH1]KFC21629.1 GDSL family lipase [Chryseobacterium sp. FH1]